MSNSKSSEDLIQELQAICDSVNDARNSGQPTKKLMERFHELSDQLGSELIKESFLSARIDLAEVRRQNHKLLKGVTRLSSSAKSIATVQRLSSDEAKELSETLQKQGEQAFYKSKAGVHNEVATVCEALHAQCVELLKQE